MLSDSILNLMNLNGSMSDMMRAPVSRSSRGGGLNMFELMGLSSGLPGGGEDVLGGIPSAASLRELMNGMAVRNAVSPEELFRPSLLTRGAVPRRAPMRPPMRPPNPMAGFASPLMSGGDTDLGALVGNLSNVFPAQYSANGGGGGRRPAAADFGMGGFDRFSEPNEVSGLYARGLASFPTSYPVDINSLNNDDPPYMSRFPFAMGGGGRMPGMGRGPGAELGNPWMNMAEFNPAAGIARMNADNYNSSRYDIPAWNGDGGGTGGGSFLGAGLPSLNMGGIIA